MCLRGVAVSRSPVEWVRVIHIRQNWLRHMQDNPNFLEKFIIGDEPSVYQYDIKTKSQSAEWHLRCIVHHDNALYHTPLFWLNLTWQKHVT